MVKILNKEKLNGWADTPCRAHLVLNNGIKPVRRALYELLLTTSISADLSTELRLSGSKEKTFLFFGLWQCSVFQLLQQMFRMFGEMFSKHMF